MFKNILVYLTMKQTQFNNEVTRFTLNTLQNFINIYIYTILYKNHIYASLNSAKPWLMGPPSHTDKRHSDGNQTAKTDT